jgi:rhodanese-related sulfurtransferase
MKYRNKTVSVVIDVRSRLEFLFGHVRGAVNIPAGRATPDELDRRGIARDAGILVYCASGARSSVVYQALKGAGFRVVDGGALAEVRIHLRDQ